MVEKEVQSWESQKFETRKAFQAFVIYRDMGINRSYRKVANQLGKSQTLIHRWAKRWEWQKRITDFEDYMADQSVKSQLEQIREMNERHILGAQLMYGKGVQKLSNINPLNLSHEEARRLVETSIKVERLARGIATENVQESVSGETRVIFEVENGDGVPKPA
jgi:hypothetical protein